ncbi:MAG: DUF1223 domain-containing protein [Bryobacteraceae bacterium]
MRRIAVATIVLSLARAVAEDYRVPVVVELFTSEGCSSCPPADDLLARLERTQPVANARIVALEEHVDYWNQLGWKDRFSNPLFRGRQNDYARAFNTENIYTPQMIVNGRSEFVGDDSSRAFEEIEKAATNRRYLIRLQAGFTPVHPELVELSVHVRKLRGEREPPATVYLAVTENKLSSKVGAGENAGRQLSHAAVVRSFGVIGTWDPKGANQVELRPTLKIPNDWKRDNLRAVIFIQEKDSHRITGAGTTELK